MNKRDRKRREQLIRTRRRNQNRIRRPKKPKEKQRKTHLSIGGCYNSPVRKGPESFEAPKDFRLLNNTEDCISFFKKIRSRKTAIYKYGRYEIRIDLSHIEHIDFASTMMLAAICYELKTSKPSYYVYGTSPIDKSCRKYLLDSGFLNDKFDEYGGKFPNSGHSASIKIERGHTRLEDSDVQQVVSIEKRICEHVTGHVGKEYSHIDMIKEICGNTVDWSDAMHDQWNYGTKFEDNEVILVALDLGKGILETICRKFSDMVGDLVASHSDVEILEGAYDRKYGSKSRKPNRNRGLPSIKYANEKGLIKNLVVITNNVILDFSDGSNSRKFIQKKSQGFNGTLYCWRIDASCYHNKK